MYLGRLRMKVSRSLAVGLASTVLYFFALQLISTVLARYSRDLGVSITGTSLVWSVLFIVSFSLRPLAGYVADKISSFLAMSLGGLFLATATIAYVFSRNLSDLIVGRIMQGIASAFFISPSIAAVATAAGGSAGMALGVRSMLVSLTSVITPPFAGALADSVGYAPVFFISALTASLLLALNASEVKHTTNKEVKHDAGGWRDSINKVVLIAAGASLFNGFLFMSLSGILQAHYRDIGYGAKVYGYFMMFFGLSSMLSRYLAGKLSSRVNPALTALLGHTINAASILMLRSMYYAPLSYVVALIYGFGMGFTVPSQQLLVAHSVASSVRNRAISIYAMGFDLGGFIGPLTYGYIASTHGYVASYQYMVIAPLSAMALMIYLLLRLRHRY